MSAAPIHIGTSGWQYRHWRPLFYADDLPTNRWLTHYATSFPGVELNSSFYRMPKERAIARWCDETPANFVFAIKAPRHLTHFKKLNNCGELLASFLSQVQHFGPRLGPILFQLPPRWRCNLRRLETFLSALPRDFRYAFEFRDRSWHIPEVDALLKAHRAAFCIYDMEGFRSPLTVCTDLVYIRLHGPATAHTGNYQVNTLRTWARHCLGWAREGKTVHLYFDNHEQGYALKNAKRLLGLVRDVGP